MTDAEAEAALIAKAEAGELHIITCEHKCGSPTPTTPEELEACAAYEYNLKDHRHFVVHTVTKLVRDRKRRWVAGSDEGDFTISLDGPQALLARLTEA